MKKRVLIMALALLLAFSLIPSAAVRADQTISVTIDGKKVNFAGQTPVNVGGRTLVPVRGVFEVMGFAVSWNGDTRQATLTKGSDVVIITLGSRTFTTNGVKHTLDVPAQSIGGRTMVPLRLPLESVGYYLDWNSATNTVVVSSTPIQTQNSNQPAEPWATLIGTTWKSDGNAYLEFTYRDGKVEIVNSSPDWDEFDVLTVKNTTVLGKSRYKANYVSSYDNRSNTRQSKGL